MYYETIRNCNYESSDNPAAAAIMAAVRAVGHRKTSDGRLLDALDNLESVLVQNVELESPAAIEACRTAEQAVADAWTAVDGD